MGIGLGSGSDGTRWEVEGRAKPQAGTDAGGPEPGRGGRRTGFEGRRHPGNNVRCKPSGPAERSFLLLPKVRWASAPGELTASVKRRDPRGERPRGERPRAPPRGASAIWVRTPGAGPRDPEAPELRSARRFPPTRSACRFQVLGPQSPTAEKPLRPTQVRAEDRGRLGRPGLDAARDVQNAEAALPVAATALPGRVEVLPCRAPAEHPPACRRCCWFSWQRSGIITRRFPGHSPRRAGASEATAPRVVGCVGSGQGAASARQVPANPDEFLSETLANFSLRLPGS